MSDAEPIVPPTLILDNDTKPFIPAIRVREAKTLTIANKMSDSNPATLNPVDVFFALGSEVRWPIVKLLADGQARNISEIRSVAGSTAENISKQLRVLLNAGILENRPGEDRRQSVFSIPAACRATPGQLDFGFCVIDLKKV